MKIENTSRQAIPVKETTTITSSDAQEETDEADIPKSIGEIAVDIIKDTGPATTP